MNPGPPCPPLLLLALVLVRNACLCVCVCVLCFTSGQALRVCKPSPRVDVSLLLKRGVFHQHACIYKG